jgi:hypothetical protein
MYKRYCHYLPCMFKGCINPTMLNSDYCYEHFDVQGREAK